MSGSIDKWLDEFGPELDPIYSRARKAKAAPKRKAPSTRPERRPLGPATRDSRRATLERIARKSPEVMVKITGGGRNMQSIKRHMDYISRNGLVELEDEQGLVHSGKEAVRECRDAWRDGGHTIPHVGEDGPREAFNVMLSMPAGTNRDAVKDAARAFAETYFKGHQYLFAEHRDTEKPHVHITVKAKGEDGRRLNPRKGDLHKWRVAFAEELRARGVDANATPRKARGVVRKAQRQALRSMAARGAEAQAQRGQFAQAMREARGGDPHGNPAQEAIGKNRVKALRVYEGIARELAAGTGQDQALALQIVDLVKSMPKLKTAHELRVAEIRETLGRTQQEPSAKDRGATDRGKQERE